MSLMYMCSPLNANAAEHYTTHCTISFLNAQAALAAVSTNDASPS